MPGAPPDRPVPQHGADPVRERTFELTRQALLAFDERLIQQCGLVSVGVGVKTIGGVTTDEPCVKTFVQRKLPAALVPPGREVPRRLVTSTAAVRTDVEEMLQPMAPPWLDHPGPETAAYWVGDPARHRPVSGGDSVSQFLTPLGTIAIGVYDLLALGQPAILSCNHVLAALNRGRYGDAVVQPAIGDGGYAPYDQCGILQRYVPVRLGAAGANLVDAAIARLDGYAAAPRVDWFGYPSAVRSGNAARPGDLVVKVGRTTGLTEGRVVAVNSSSWIPYPPILGGGVALFKDQIITTAMAGFGDSGALLLDGASNAIGLLFGGSPTHTFFNDIVNVQQQLAIAIPLRR